MKKIHITYFAHGTTLDNENDIASGWSDVDLSDLGRKQSEELRNHIRNKKFDLVFTSDLRRAVNSAKITFGDSVKIIQDKRLRECNYGLLNGAQCKEVEEKTLEHLTKPFPKGESY